MPQMYSPQSRVERLVAGGRALLSTVSLLAIYLDPAEPVRHQRVAYTLLAAYCVYAIATAIAAWNAPPASHRWKLATHVFDLLIFSVFMYLTEGPSSPFFVYFLFSLLCGTLRFHWRGALWTAVASLSIYLAMGFYAEEILHDPLFELNRFIIRSFHLALMAAFLVNLGVYQERLQNELLKLAKWPRAIARDQQKLVMEMLEHARDVLSVPRVLVAWEPDDEPWLYLAMMSDAGLELVREPPNRYELFNDADPPTLIRRRRPTLPAELVARFQIGPFLSAPFSGEGVKGRLLFLDRAELSLDDVRLAEIVAGLVLTRLEQFYLLERMEQIAISDERIRLSRDLHDGLLQSLTGAALRLETLRRQLDRDPAQARQTLESVQQVIASDQRELRAFIGDLRPRPFADVDRSRLRKRLESLAERFRHQWDLGVEVSLEGLGGSIAEELGQEIYAIVNEAVANAAKHAGASHIWIEVESNEISARITIRDDGKGFPFQGRYDLETLTRIKRGPVTLKERIASLNGQLTLDSSERGTR
ncbi:MAG TPA: histidine kinase, partial [Thermoanaerobaculia bacterium]